MSLVVQTLLTSKSLKLPAITHFSREPSRKSHWKRLKLHKNGAWEITGVRNSLRPPKESYRRGYSREASIQCYTGHYPCHSTTHLGAVAQVRWQDPSAATGPFHDRFLSLISAGDELPIYLGKAVCRGTGLLLENLRGWLLCLCKWCCKLQLC